MGTEVELASHYQLEAAGNFADLWAEELGSDFDPSLVIQRIKIPSAGGIAWEVPNGSDEPDVVKDLQGVIVAHHQSSRLYFDSFEDRNPDDSGRPDAWSVDGKVQVVPEETVLKAKGRGWPVPSTDLTRCPYNQFGSLNSIAGRPGNSKLNRNYVELFLFLGGDTMFPYQVSIPATSLKAWRQYAAQAVLAKGKRLTDVVTSLKLVKEQSQGDITYSSVVFSVADVLPGPTALQLREYSQGIKQLVTRDPFAKLRTDNERDEGYFEPANAAVEAATEVDNGAVVEPAGDAGVEAVAQAFDATPVGATAADGIDF